VRLLFFSSWPLFPRERKKRDQKENNSTNGIDCYSEIDSKSNFEVGIQIETSNRRNNNEVLWRFFKGDSRKDFPEEQ
jgi:hypothetical protein